MRGELKGLRKLLGVRGLHLIKDGIKTGHYIPLIPYICSKFCKHD
jgi:hypothetical protein